MAQNQKRNPLGGNGIELTLADLPPPNTQRWFPSRKVLVARAVESGLLSFEEASKRYSLSAEEFAGWLKLAGPSRITSSPALIREALRISL